MRIDILTQVDGLEFEAAFARAAKGKYGKVDVAFLSIADLIKNKKEVGRPQDLLDVAKLEALAPKKRTARPTKPKRPAKRKA